MMLASNAAAVLNPRGLRQPFSGGGKALGRGHPVRTRTRTRTGWDGHLHTMSVDGVAGMGSTLLEQSLAYNWLEHINDTVPPAPTAEWTAYYGPGGTYSQRVSVQTAAREEAYASEPNQDSGPVSLYVMEACSPMDPGCVARNEQRELANLRIIENANRAFNMQVCRYNAGLNPGTVNDRDCDGLYSPLPVLSASGDMRTVSPSRGSYSMPMGGETAAQLQARTQAWTAQQSASATTNQPNQSVPPLPQGGEVVVGGTRTTFNFIDDSGKILGLEPMTLALIAAGVGALLLLKK